MSLRLDLHKLVVLVYPLSLDNPDYLHISICLANLNSFFLDSIALTNALFPVTFVRDTLRIVNHNTIAFEIIIYERSFVSELICSSSWSQALPAQVYHSIHLQSTFAMPLPLNELPSINCTVRQCKLSETIVLVILEATFVLKYGNSFFSSYDPSALSMKHICFPLAFFEIAWLGVFALCTNALFEVSYVGSFIC